MFPPSKDPAEFSEIAARLLAAQNALQEQGREARLAAAGAPANEPPTLLPPSRAAVSLTEAENPMIEQLVKRQLAIFSQQDLESAAAVDDKQYQTVIATAEPAELRQIAADKGWRVLAQETKIWVPEFRNQMRAVLASFPKRARNNLAGVSNRVSARPPPAAAVSPKALALPMPTPDFDSSDWATSESTSDNVSDSAWTDTTEPAAAPKLAKPAINLYAPNGPSTNQRLDAIAAEFGISLEPYHKKKYKFEQRKRDLQERIDALALSGAAAPSTSSTASTSGLISDPAASTGMGIGKRPSKGLSRHNAYVVDHFGNLGALKGVDVRRLAVEHVLWVGGKRASPKLEPQVAADLVALLGKRTQRRTFMPQAVNIFRELVAKSGLPARHGSYKWALIAPETARNRVAVVAGQAQAVPQMIERAALLMSAVAAGNSSTEVRDELAQLLHGLHRAGAMSKSALIENMTKIL